MAQTSRCICCWSKFAAISIMSNQLALLQFGQTECATKCLAHWAILLTEDELGTIFHFTQSDAKYMFECHTAPRDHWTKHRLLVGYRHIDNTTMSRQHIESVCRQQAAEYHFNFVANNCQNFAMQCLAALGLACPVLPANIVCNCVMHPSVSSPQAIRRCSIN